jgi:hypothetical protein
MHQIDLPLSVLAEDTKEQVALLAASPVEQ